MSQYKKAKYVFLVLTMYLVSYVAIQLSITTGSYDFTTSFDEMIPFLPQWIWIYHSIIPVIFATSFFMIRTRRLFFTMIWSCVAATIVLNLFYIYLPSFYPRLEFEVTSVSEYLVELTRTIDRANNTFPSGHVTFAWLVYYAASFSRLGNKFATLRIAYFVWASMISFATLALKQHYIVDVVSGIVLATLCFYAARSMLNNYSISITRSNESRA